MIIKAGVSVKGIRPETLLGMLVCKDIVESYDVEFVVTSVVGGKHGRGSLHFVGLAFDFRTRDLLNQANKQECQFRCSKALGKEYDVVLESDHMHVEYQPKT